ncbi:tyrosine-type recombinase/integrase [Exiguobacterium algae]|uniref:tyrosine-type recombinase/integrase n=1 Tax=Exiguobacterium algae TaxID=2751250 RepID=UPI001BED2E8F|nr:tyrosine-type recombinase/integrase [Exiguobacterium algae]
MKKMLLHDAIQCFLEDLEVRREKPETTLKTYRNTLGRFETFVSARGVVYIQDVMEDKHARPYKASLNGLADNTVRTYIMAIRSLFTFALQKRWVKQNPFQHIVTRSTVQRQQTIISRDQFETILHYARNATLYAIYLVGGDAGLRISETLALELHHLDFRHQMILVANGKGDKARHVPMSARLAKELSHYIEKDRPQAGNSNLVFLMPKGTPVRANFVNEDLKKIAEKHLGIELTTHQLRHSFATTVYNNMHDLMVVKELLGHERVETTERYLHVTREQTRKAIEGLNG